MLDNGQEYYENTENVSRGCGGKNGHNHEVDHGRQNGVMLIFRDGEEGLGGAPSGEREQTLRFNTPRVIGSAAQRRTYFGEKSCMA